jgi:hypothetical protein
MVSETESIGQHVKVARTVPSDLPVVIRNTCDGPDYFVKAYNSNPTGKRRPAWLRHAYRGVTDRIGKPLDPAILADPRYRECKNRDKMAECWPYFVYTVHAHILQVEAAGREINHEHVATILGVTVDEVNEDVALGLLPTIAGSNGTLIDGDILREQLIKEVTNSRRHSRSNQRSQTT